MKNVVDSCGWIEYFTDGANASFFSKPLEDIRNLIVPSICLFEVFKKIYRQAGEAEALEAVTLMRQGEVIAVDEAVAIEAARLSAEHQLPMADSIVLACGRLNHAVVWTQDADFKTLPGVKYVEK
jgi:predicted nucleic acid-binding protein